MQKRELRSEITYTRLTPRLKTKLKRLAKKNRMSMSDVLMYLVERYKG